MIGLSKLHVIIADDEILKAAAIRKALNFRC